MKFRSHESLEAGRLLPERLLLDPATLILQVIADVGHPQRAVGTISGGGEIVLGLAICDDRGRRNAADGDANWSPFWLSGQHPLQWYLDPPLFRLNRQCRIRLYIGQVQHDANCDNSFLPRDRRLVARQSNWPMRLRLPAIWLHQLIFFVEAIAF